MAGAESVPAVLDAERVSETGARARFPGKAEITEPECYVRTYDANVI